MHIYNLLGFITCNDKNRILALRFTNKDAIQRTNFINTDDWQSRQKALPETY